MRKWIALLVFLALGWDVPLGKRAFALPPKDVSIRVRFVDAVFDPSHAPFSGIWYFAATEADLKRRLILNLGTNRALRDLEISVNGQKQPIALPADMRSASLELAKTLVPGKNRLEISSRQPLAYGKTPDEMERQEQALEARFHSEEANQNLFFVIEIDPTLDVWSVVDLLQTLPYFEEVDPYFAPD